MTGPFEIDVEKVRAYHAGLSAEQAECPLCGEPTRISVTEKLTTVDEATGTAKFLGRDVPVRDMVVWECTDCQWGKEVTANPPALDVTHAGLGYVQEPPPRVGE
jgi:hypothetical protein